MKGAWIKIGSSDGPYIPLLVLQYLHLGNLRVEGIVCAIPWSRN